MGLLRADLQVLVNLFVRRGGGRIAASAVLSLATLTGISFLAGGAVLAHPELMVLLHGGGENTRTLLALTLMPSLMVAVWFGLLQSQRMLFEAQELDLWLTAPLPAWRPPLHCFLRVLFLTTLWALALCGPAAAMVLARSGAPPASYWLLPVAVAVSITPLLATVMAIHIVLLRWFASRLTKLLLSLAMMAASLAFTVFLLVGVFAREDQAERVADLVRSRPGLPAAVRLGADLLAGSAQGSLQFAALQPALTWLLGTLLVLFLVSFWHPRAVEASRRADRPMFRPLVRRSDWPASVWRSLMRKELCQLMQMPGQLLGMLVFGVLVWVLARQRVLVGGVLEMTHLPLVLRQCTAMTVLWLLAVMMVLYAHMGRLTLADGRQWPLYMASPARPGSILAGKLAAIYLLLGWPVLLAAFAGAYELGASWQVVLVFCGIALGGNAAALGILAAVGTMPLLMRPDTDGQIVQNTRSILAAFLLVLGFELAVTPGFFAFLLLHEAWRHGPPRGIWGDPGTLGGLAVAGAWGLALLFGGLGCLWGARNFRRLLLPRTA